MRRRGADLGQGESFGAGAVVQGRGSGAGGTLVGGSGLCSAGASGLCEGKGSGALPGVILQTEVVVTEMRPLREEDVLAQGTLSCAPGITWESRGNRALAGPDPAGLGRGLCSSPELRWGLGCRQGPMLRVRHLRALCCLTQLVLPER